MDFNKELQELINKANQNGYDFKNGKFERTKELKFPVMEEFLIDNSTEESTGYWKIFKKTVRISEEDYKEIIDYAKKHNSEDIRCRCSIDIDEEFLEKIIDNIDKYDESKMDITETNIGGTIRIWYDDSYYIYNDEESECVDLWFSKEYDDCDFPRGYISFYEMSSTDFEKADDINLNIEKFMKYN